MIKISLPNEIYSCIRSGWKMFNRDGDRLAYFTKKTSSGKIQKLYENGNRFLLDESGNTILIRNKDGLVTMFDNISCRNFTWTKNSKTGKYGWFYPTQNLWK